MHYANNRNPAGAKASLSSPGELRNPSFCVCLNRIGPPSSASPYRPR